MLDHELELRTALRRATAKAKEKGDRRWVVLNVAFGRYEVLEHPPVTGRFWEVRDDGRVIPH